MLFVQLTQNQSHYSWLGLLLNSFNESLTCRGVQILDSLLISHFTIAYFFPNRLSFRYYTKYNQPVLKGMKSCLPKAGTQRFIYYWLDRANLLWLLINFFKSRHALIACINQFAKAFL